MVICIIALPIFALLGLFSLKYRTLTKEAFRCLFRTVVLKPCDTGLDLKIKSKFTAKLMWFPALARAFYKYFAILSWIFVILMLVSTYFTGLGIYNYARYGNCNGPNNDQFCIFNVVHPAQAACSTLGTKGKLYPEFVKIEGYPKTGNPNAPLTIVEYGCFSCPYTVQAEPVMRRVLRENPDVNLVYHDVPLSIHNYSVGACEAAICAGEQGKYWRYHDLLFERHSELNDSMFVAIAQDLNLSMEDFKTCLVSNETKLKMDLAYADALTVGIYGTPTFFINNQSLVGPQSFDKFISVINQELKQ